MSETEHTAQLPSLARGILDRSTALRALCAQLEARGALVTAGRAPPGAGALVLAGLRLALTRPILLVTAGLDDADRWRRDWATLLDGPVEDFPPWESLFERDSEPDPDIFARRTAVQDSFAANRPVAVVAPVQAILQPVARRTGPERSGSERSGSERSGPQRSGPQRSGPQRTGPGTPAAQRAEPTRAPPDSDRRVAVAVGDDLPPGDLARRLIDAGYRRFPQVARPGDFSIRGGIFDIYPREGAHPYRIEYFGDEIDSIRAVDPATQRSGEEVARVLLTLQPKQDYFIRGFTGHELTLFDRLPSDTVLAVAAPREVDERCRQLLGQWAPRREQALVAELWASTGRLSRLDLDPLVPEPGRRPVMLPVTSAERFHGSLETVLERIREEADRGTPLRVHFRLEAEIERFQEILDEAGIGPACRPVFGDLSTSFCWSEPPAASGIFLAGSELLGRMRSLQRRSARRERRGQVVQSFLEFSEGDLVVHVTHGIARYRGLRTVEQGRRRGEHLLLEFREGVQVLVPADRIDLVQKYVGGARALPMLDKVGGATWAKKKERVEEAVHDLAAEMLELQALRAEKPGHAFPTDNHWQHEFEAAFPFDETQDQTDSIAAIRRDMETPRPMDRLVCGDVGYGKTELAMRAAFKCVQSGKQVAVLVPTTILAQQHLVTFRERMAEFPVRIEALSRMRSRREQTEMLQRAQLGELDVLIGTHRLLSGDVVLRDLGLVIIDEEQRFGVIHKERLKQLRRTVDVLTLTATPIPRTLHMALLGVRDISSLQEAPVGRRAVRTEVCTFDEARFRDIILRELNRDGQVFFIHNRVQTIQACTQELARLVPEARIIFVHGQMDEHELEDRMAAFLNKEFDLLVSTTIIESGLDIPSANTLIVDRADRFGLAELHQLRGRVGRGPHQAYAYLLVPEDRPVNDDARQRLQAIEEFSSLGAGFQIAMRDLEIRGAGNILGREQSGHIATIGYDLYCRLLEKAVAELRGSPYLEPPDVELAIAGSAGLPEDFIPDATQRLRTYRSIATALEPEEVSEVEQALVDQHGDLPEAVRGLLFQQLLRIELGRHGARRASIEDGWLILEGDLVALERHFRAGHWEARRLPDGLLAVHPREGRRLSSLAEVARAVLSGTVDGPAARDAAVPAPRVVPTQRGVPGKRSTPGKRGAP